MWFDLLGRHAGFLDVSWARRCVEEIVVGVVVGGISSIGSRSSSCSSSSSSSRSSSSSSR